MDKNVTNELLERISLQLEKISVQLAAGPKVVYSVSMGNLMEIANAPAEIFQPEFLQTLSSDMQQILKPKPKIDPSKSNEYKKKPTIGEA